MTHERLQASVSRFCDLVLAGAEGFEAYSNSILGAHERALAQTFAATRDYLGDALFLPQTRRAYRRILNLGYTEAFRARVQGPGHYSFWAYQGGAWSRNDGIRIDHVLMTPQAADLLLDCQIDAHVRDREKPSDHVPVWVELAA